MTVIHTDTQTHRLPPTNWRTPCFLLQTQIHTFTLNTHIHTYANAQATSYKLENSLFSPSDSETHQIHSNPNVLPSQRRVCIVVPAICSAPVMWTPSSISTMCLSLVKERFLRHNYRTLLHRKSSRYVYVCVCGWVWVRVCMYVCTGISTMCSY